MFINVFGVKTYDGPQWINQKDNFNFCLPYFLNGSLMAYILFYLENYYKSFFEIRYKDLFANILTIILVIISIHYDHTVCTIYKCSNSIFQPFFPTPNKIWSLAILFMLISSENTNYVRSYFETNRFLSITAKFSYGIYLWHPFAIKITFELFKHLKNMHLLGALDEFLTLTAICLIISALFYHLIENNLINIAQTICKKIDRFKSEESLNNL